jgi:FKBP-type peptidyl-prolyl cis-trans isomerase 2
VQDTAVFIQGKHQVLPALERAVTVAELSETAAVLDYNHPLAGKTLVVQIKILKVENPS